MPKSALTAENTSETLSMDATSPSPGNEVNAECTETDGVLALIRCVLSHLHKESAEFESAAEQLLSSLHLLLQSLSIRHDASKEEMNTHTEEPGSFHKEGSSEKQDLVAYLHSILKDCSQPGESQKKCDYSFNDCIKRVRCFKIALEWLFSHIHSNLEPHLLRIFKNTINGLEVTAKHLESLQKEDGLVNDAHAESHDLDPLLLATQSLELNSSSNGSTDHSEMASIKMVSAGDEKSSVTETGPHSFLTKLCASWNSQSKISPNAEKSTTSNQSVSALTHNSTKVSVNVTDDPSVEPKCPESFSSHVMSTEPSNITISNDDSSISSSDETDRLIILSLPENSESLVSSKECANLLDILSIKDHSKASTSDDINKCLEEETNHLLPESTSSKTGTIELPVVNTVGPNVNFISVNAAIPQEEGVKQAEPVPPCSITQTDVVQIAGEDDSISTPANNTEETTLSGKTSSLSQLPCKNQTSKRTQRKHAVWRVSIPSDEINENINFLPEVRQTRSQAMKKANDSLKIIIHKVTDAEGSSSIEDNCSPCTERNPRKRRRKSSKVKVLQTSESTGEESCLPSVQQAPLIPHLWKKHKVSHKNTSQGCDKAPAVNLNESSVINGQPESQPPDTSANSECQEKTVDVNELQSPLDLSPKQSLEMSSEISQRSITSSALVNPIEEKNEIPQAIVRTQNENEAEVNVFSQSQSYNPSVTPVSPPSVVMETEISSNQFTQPNILVQDALVEFNFPLENTVLPQSTDNTNIPYEGEVPRITSAENQLSLQQTEGRVSQINEDLNALSSVNQNYCLQPFTTAGTSYRESNRNGIDKSNNLSLVQYYEGQIPHLQETVAAPRSDETTYNCGTFNGDHAVPNNMNVMSPSNIQGVSHFGPLVQYPTFDGVRIPSNGPAEQGPGASNRREAHHLNNESKVEQPPLNLGNMVDLAFSSGMLIPHSALSLYGRQRLEICGSRAPEIMGPSEAEQTPHTLTLADLALASGALIPRNSPPLLYGRQRQICAPETMDSPIIGHRPHIMGAAFATDTENAAQTPVNEVLTPYERYVREMNVSSVNQAPANMYAIQGPSLATVTSQSLNNERQMPENINSTPQQGNRRQRRPAGTTAPRGRKRPQRVTGALNIAHENNELREAQRMTVPNAGHIPGNMMNLNAGTSNMGYRNIHPAQQFNHISAEGAIAHAPYNYFGGNTGQRPPALQRPLPRGQIPPFPRGHLSPLSNLNHMYWYSLPQSAWNNQGQMGFLQPSPASYLHNNQRNQSSQNPRVQQTRN